MTQDGLGDTIRVSLTEPPEEEIDPCMRLANLGTRAAELRKGVVSHFIILAVGISLFFIWFNFLTGAF